MLRIQYDGSKSLGGFSLLQEGGGHEGMRWSHQESEKRGGRGREEESTMFTYYSENYDNKSSSQSALQIQSGILEKVVLVYFSLCSKCDLDLRIQDDRTKAFFWSTPFVCARIDEHDEVD